MDQDSLEKQPQNPSMPAWGVDSGTPDTFGTPNIADAQSDVLKKFDSILEEVNSSGFTDLSFTGSGYASNYLDTQNTPPLNDSPRDSLATPQAQPFADPSFGGAPFGGETQFAGQTAQATTQVPAENIAQNAAEAVGAPAKKPVNKWLEKKAAKWFEPAAPTSVAPQNIAPPNRPVAPNPNAISGANDAQSKGFEQVYLEEGITGVGKNMIQKAKSKSFGFYLKVGFFVALVVAGVWILSNPNSYLSKIASEEIASESANQKNIEGIVDNPPPAELMNRPTNILEQQGLVDLPQDSVCGLTPGDITFDATFDSDSVSWIGSTVLSLPISSAYGGNVKKDGILNTCYQFSTQGAALAAANYVGMLNDSHKLDVLFKNAVINTGIPYKSQQLVDEEVDFPEISIYGYKISNTFENATTVDIGLSTQDGQDMFAHLFIPLKWADGDWKTIAKNGEIDTRVDEIGSLKGFTKF